MTSDVRTVTTLTAIGSACLLSASCATTDDNEFSEGDYRVIPIARLVSSADAPITWGFLQPYKQRLEIPAADFNDRFRRPGPDGDITIVDCQTVESIGIYFLLDTFVERPKSRTRTFRPPRFSWTHSKREFKGSKYNHFHYGESFKPKGGSGWLTAYTESFRFRYDHERVDGRYAVTVHYLGDIIYQDSFELVGCD